MFKNFKNQLLIFILNLNNDQINELISENYDILHNLYTFDCQQLSQITVFTELETPEEYTNYLLNKAKSYNFEDFKIFYPVDIFLQQSDGYPCHSKTQFISNTLFSIYNPMMPFQTLLPQFQNDIFQILLTQYLQIIQNLIKNKPIQPQKNIFNHEEAIKFHHKYVEYKEEAFMVDFLYQEWIQNMKINEQNYDLLQILHEFSYNDRQIYDQHTNDINKIHKNYKKFRAQPYQNSQNSQNSDINNNNNQSIDNNFMNFSNQEQNYNNNQIQNLTKLYKRKPKQLQLKSEVFQFQQVSDSSDSYNYINPDLDTFTKQTLQDAKSNKNYTNTNINNKISTKNNNKNHQKMHSSDQQDSESEIISISTDI